MPPRPSDPSGCPSPPTGVNADLGGGGREGIPGGCPSGPIPPANDPRGCPSGPIPPANDPKGCPPGIEPGIEPGIPPGMLPKPGMKEEGLLGSKGGRDEDGDGDEDPPDGIFGSVGRGGKDEGWEGKGEDPPGEKPGLRVGAEPTGGRFEAPPLRP